MDRNNTALWKAHIPCLDLSSLSLSLSIMTVITKHVRRLLLKRLVYGWEGGWCPAWGWGWGYKHRLPVSAPHTADVSHCEAPCPPPAPFINLLFMQEWGRFQMMSLTAPASFTHVAAKSHSTDALSSVWSKYTLDWGGGGGGTTTTGFHMITGL